MLTPQHHFLFVSAVQFDERLEVYFPPTSARTSVELASLLLGCRFVNLCKINEVKPEKEGVSVIGAAVPLCYLSTNK